MLQRVQSIYLSSVCISMAILLNVSIWTKVSLNNASYFAMKVYALVSSSGQYIIFPYGLSFLVASFVILVAAYTIFRHDSRKLQLQLISSTNGVLILLVVLVFYFIKKADGTYLTDGLSTYTYHAGISLPFIALVANLLARYHIKNDEHLVNEDSLR